MERWGVAFLHAESILRKVRQAAVTEQDCRNRGAGETTAASRQAVAKLPNWFLSFAVKSAFSPTREGKNAFVSFLFPLIRKGRSKKVYVTGEEVN